MTPRTVVGYEKWHAKVAPRPLPLPNELILEALEYLSAVELAGCRAVCRQLRHLIDTTPRLQYNLRLFLASMVDMRSNSNVNTALSKLTNVQNAWKKFRLSRQVTLPCYHGRVLFTCDYKVSAGVLGQQNGLHGITFHQLSSTPQGITVKEWEIGSLGFVLYSFSMDVSQDLLVALEIRLNEVNDIIGMNLHLLSLRTGQPHPLAEIPVMTVDYDGHTGCVGVEADVCEGTLVFMAVTEVVECVSELWVWNWKTGKLLINGYNSVEYEDSKLVDVLTGTSSFKLLDAHRVLLPVIEETADYAASTALYVFDCRRTISGRNTYKHIARDNTTFLLPSLSSRAAFVQFYCVNNTPPPTTSTATFCPDPALNIIAFQIGIMDVTASPTPQNTSYFYLFVRTESLLRRCNEGPSCSYTWNNDWRQDALMIPKPGDPDIWLLDEVSHKQCLVMERRIEDMDEQDEDAPMPIMIYDFPTVASMRYELSSGERLGKWRYMVEPKVLVDKMWADGEVRSGLAYRKLDTGFIAHPVDIPGEMKEHALTGEYYLQCDNLCWKVTQLPGPSLS